MFIFLVVIVAPELSNIAAGWSVAAAAGTITGRHSPFNCGSVASLHCNVCNCLPIQTLLQLPTTAISAAAAASTTIAIAILAGRLVVMLLSRNFSFA
jgi:hypothetical protein